MLGINFFFFNMRGRSSPSALTPL